MKKILMLGLFLASLNVVAGEWREVRIKNIVLDLASETASVTYSPVGSYVRGSLASTEVKSPVVKSSLQNALISLLDQSLVAKRSTWLILNEGGEITQVWKE